MALHRPTLRKSKIEFTIFEPLTPQLQTAQSNCNESHCTVTAQMLWLQTFVVHFHLTWPPHSGVCNPAPTQALGASVSSDRGKEWHCWSSKPGTKAHQGLRGWHNWACRGEHYRNWLITCLWWKPPFCPLWPNFSGFPVPKLSSTQWYEINEQFCRGSRAWYPGVATALSTV